MKKKNHLQTITGERKDLIGYFTVFPLHNCSSDDPLTAKIENIDSRNLGKFKGKNIHEEYNTYGLEWTDSEYIFYVNGVETRRTSFSKGVSQV